MTMRKTDYAALIGKGAFGAIPFAGPLLAEIVGNLIPNQRLDRLEAFFKELELRVGNVEDEKLIELLKTPESIDLLEDACLHATRAMSPERIKYIAELFNNAVTNNEINHIEAKRLFTLLSEVNDIEIIILKYHTLKSGHNEFTNLHKNIMLYPNTQGLPQQKRKEKVALFNSHRTHLVSLGLLLLTFKRIRKFESPEIDPNTGMQKSDGFKISELGRLLINSIGEGTSGS